MAVCRANDLRIGAQALVSRRSKRRGCGALSEGDVVDLSQRSDLTQGLHRSTGSYELVLGAVLFALFGLLVDRAIGTTPWLTVAFAVFGFVGAAVSIYYRYQQTMAEYAELREST